MIAAAPTLSHTNQNEVGCPTCRRVCERWDFRQIEVERVEFDFLSAVPCCFPPYWAVSVNVTTGCPSPYGPSAVTCTGPELDGKVSVTFAIPDPD